MLMCLSDKIQLVGRLHQFIKRKGTGCHRAFAKRLGISVSALYRHLDTLKNLGAEIEYCTDRKTYYYVNNFEFKF